MIDIDIMLTKSETRTLKLETSLKKGQGAI